MPTERQMPNQMCRVQSHCHSPPKPVRHYYGLTEGPFKTRYYNHIHSFRNKSYKNDTELSKYIWDLQDSSQQYQIEWDIVHHAAPYKCGTRRCDVCLTEKMVIATANPATMLNKRAEIVSTCLHRAKFRYENVLDAPTLTVKSDPASSL